MRRDCSIYIESRLRVSHVSVVYSMSCGSTRLFNRQRNSIVMGVLFYGFVPMIFPLLVVPAFVVKIQYFNFVAATVPHPQNSHSTSLQREFLD